MSKKNFILETKLEKECQIVQTATFGRKQLQNVFAVIRIFHFNYSVMLIEFCLIFVWGQTKKKFLVETNRVKSESFDENNNMRKTGS